MKKVIFFVALILVFTEAVFSVDFPVIKGWKKAGRVKEYDPSNLWEYIDGAADLFLSYGFRYLRTCDIQSEKLIVTVNIYDMGSKLNAFGVYKTEVPETDKIISGITGVVLAPYQCLLLKDRFYIKIDAYEGKISESSGEKLLKAVYLSLQGDAGLPREFNILPLKNRIKGSENYVKKSFSGISYLNNVISAKYKEKKKVYKVFYVIPDNSNIKKLEEKLSSGWQVKTKKLLKFYFREIPYQGTVGIVKYKNGYMGLTGFNKTRDVIRRLSGICN